MAGLKGSSLLETIVAATLFLTVFALSLDMLPPLSVREGEAQLTAEAEHFMAQAREKYGTGLWRCGSYTETAGTATLEVRVEPYRAYVGIGLLTIEARIDGSRKRIVCKYLIECPHLYGDRPLSKHW